MKFLLEDLFKGKYRPQITISVSAEEMAAKCRYTC